MTKHYANRPSQLLTPLQNKWVIHALRQNCTALLITVAIMHVYFETNDAVIQFGIVTIERDAKMKKYFFRVYNMENLNLLIQREIKKSIGTPFTMLGGFFIQMEMDKLRVVFEFIDTKRAHSGSYEYNDVKKALCGNFKKLKYLAEMQYYHDNSHMYSQEKESQVDRLICSKDTDGYGFVKKSKHKLPPSDKSSKIDDGVEAARIAKSSPTNLASNPGIQNLLLQFGIYLDDVYRTDCSEEVKQFIAKHGGFDKFKQTAVQHGIDLDEGLPESPPESPLKLVLDRLAAFDLAKQVEIPKNDDICKSPGKRLEEEEEFVASELIPDKDASTSSPKPSTTTGEAASTSRPGTSEKMAEPAANENVRKRFLPDAFVLEFNRIRQRINEKVRNRKAKKKLKKEQKAKKGQPVSTTPEQTPEKEAPMETKKTPSKEVSKTPKKDPSSVSDTTDDTESDSDDNSD